MGWEDLEGFGVLLLVSSAASVGLYGLGFGFARGIGVSRKIALGLTAVLPVAILSIGTPFNHLRPRRPMNPTEVFAGYISLALFILQVASLIYLGISVYRRRTKSEIALFFLTLLACVDGLWSLLMLFGAAMMIQNTPL